MQTYSHKYGAFKAHRIVGDGMHALSNDEIRHAAPSVFAEAAHDSRSQRYAYIPTFKVVDALRANGFLPVQAAQSRSRMGRHDHTKHMIKFARLGEVSTRGEVVPQVALVNSHDGTSAYKLLGGLFRFICFNGLIMSDSAVQSLKVAHTGDVRDRVIEGSFQVIDGASKAGTVTDTWRAINLDSRESESFATAAALLRWDGDKGAPIDTVRLLDAHRSEDTSANLWTTFNRVQENLLRGGQRGRDANHRRFSVRPINGIDDNVKLNRALWSLAESMAAIKQAA